jgi:channel protein (hemolysin III family)
MERRDAALSSGRARGHRPQAAAARPLARGGVVVSPQLLGEIGLSASLLVLAGGLLYTLGALVYALRRPDPRPAVFGFHEVFHVLVIAAVACQYSAVAFFVLPEH